MSTAALAGHGKDALLPTPADAERQAEGMPPQRLVIAYGFWIFLLSDFIIFSALFAAYAVLGSQTAGGPTPVQLFHLPHVFAETACLLASSYTCGLATLSLGRGRRGWFFLLAALTFGLGATFLVLEATEFAGMVAQGAGPSRSAFLSAFFTLVGTHGVHVTSGLIWLAVMMAQVTSKGITGRVLGRLHCFSLFWHALDIIWVALFTVVYLAGAR